MNNGEFNWARVEEFLRREERGWVWLAGKTGISYNLLWRVRRGDRRLQPGIRQALEDVMATWVSQR